MSPNHLNPSPESLPPFSPIRRVAGDEWFKRVAVSAGTLVLVSSLASAGEVGLELSEEEKSEVREILESVEIAPKEGEAAAKPEVPTAAPAPEVPAITEEVEVAPSNVPVPDGGGVLPSQIAPDNPGLLAPPLEGDGGGIPLDEALPGEEVSLPSGPGPEVAPEVLPELLNFEEDPESTEDLEGLEGLFDEELTEEEELEDPAYWTPGSTARFYEPAAYDSGVIGGELLPPGFGVPLMREGFRFGLGVFANYDSNINLSETDEVGDFFLTLAPSLEYRSGPPEGVPGIVTLAYSPYIRTYLDESSFNSVDHSGSAGINYAGVKGAFGANADYASFSESNRIVGGVVDVESYSFSLSGSYRTTERTMIDVGWSHHFTGYDELDSGRSDSEVSSLQVTGQWAARENLWIGPAFRHSESISDSIGTSDTYSYLFSLGWDPNGVDGLSIWSTAGLEVVDGALEDSNSDGFTGSLGVSYQGNDRLQARVALSYETIAQQNLERFGETGGGGKRVTGNVSVVYTPSELWTARGALAMRTTPSPSGEGQSANTTTLNLALARSLQLAKLTVGASYGVTDFDAEVTGGDRREDDNRFSAYVKYDRGVLAGRAAFQSTVRWTDNSGDTDWSRFQVSTGLNFEF